MNNRARFVAIGLTMVLASTAFADDKPPAGTESVQDLIFLGDNRPIFIRLRMSLGPQPFRVAWMNSVKAMYAYLDRNNDGTLTKEEADRGALATLVRVANGGATAMPRGDLDVHPKDGIVSLDELSDALRVALGPFRVQVGKVASGKTDALFTQLDGDKDGKLTRLELTEAASSLHKLDLDDDELIDILELEPFTDPLNMQMDEMNGRRPRSLEGPPVVELYPDDSSLRPVRLLLKKYDKPTGRTTSLGDNKLTRSEFAIDATAFAKADVDGDGSLDTEELRRFLARATPDIELKISFSADATGSATVAVEGSKPLPAWIKVKPLGTGDVEIAADEVRLEIHVDDGAAALAGSRQTYMAQFEAADADNNGYVEKSEVTKDKDHPSPLASLFDILDRDGDGKLYPKELNEFVDKQGAAARDRMVLTTSDQGRAIFSILDLNRDRRLGHREIRGTLDRVGTWDRDGDARITADEIPHYYQLTLGRGQLGGISNIGIFVDRRIEGQAVDPITSGPNWFRRMDRNRDGDVSAREFLGPRAQFQRLDRDKDGLIDATEASSTSTTADTRGATGKN
jgi:Ca2+-binding EF-hand superfamily protein